ncbi:type II toxin-antitoxin system VapC family toxin [Asticcacaulis sp. EMRT-3]|uniref:type II toxin-antitoxin system VapC family toxin n=1 Tax=Asticcacaulis sp. EMRT-3 TaxID=3040349 RepID=UPI0024AFC5AE|nr:type II toxin-antitoxin system VapC family toxin [Asticcacaulis sp. EMRT-3]MDI7775919.1 type II toxin-antitoxin system VapC family toxin [Asticcacaulis sp. EMRT-3]
MSLVLLDTHVLIWTVTQSHRIGPQTQALLERASVHSEVCISAITIWEIAMLESKARLNLDRDAEKWLETIFEQGGLSLIPLAPAISFDSTRLPGNFHNDPSDRLIVATARYLNAHLITEDAAILAYARQGHVKAVSPSL